MNLNKAKNFILLYIILFSYKSNNHRQNSLDNIFSFIKFRSMITIDYNLQTTIFSNLLLDYPKILL